MTTKEQSTVLIVEDPISQEASQPSLKLRRARRGARLGFTIL